MSTPTYRQWADPAAQTALRLLAAEVDETAWQDRALCAQADPERWFPERGESTLWPKRICAQCPVAADCLQYALDNGISHGVWGGLSERERRRIKRGQLDRAAA